jgi:hypothetical protein
MNLPLQHVVYTSPRFARNHIHSSNESDSIIANTTDFRWVVSVEWCLHMGDF